jgi:hypothetical protein
MRLRVISSKYTRLSRLCVCELCLNRHESTRCSRDRSRSSPSQMSICFSSGVIFLGNHISNSPSVDLRLRCVLRGHERRPGDTVFRAVSHCWRKIAVIFQHKPTGIARGGRRHLAVFRVVPTERAKFAIEADRLHAHPLVRSCASHLAPKELESLPVSVMREQSLRAVILPQAIGVGVVGITIATVERARAAIRRHKTARHMSVPARRLRQTLFVDGGRRRRPLRQSQPGKEQGQPYNQCSRTNYLFAISILLLDFTLPFAKHLSLGVAAMWLLNLQSRLGGPAAAIAGPERDHLGSRGYLPLPRTAPACSWELE